MKKKLMMVAVLVGTLSLGACVDDGESQSVTNVRNAKTEQLKALTALSNAKTEAELIKANAEKALNEAEAAYKQALRDAKVTETEYYKQKYALDLEHLKAQYEKDIAYFKFLATGYEKDIWDNADAFVQDVYGKYTSALDKINDINGNLITQKLRLAQIDIDEISAKAALESFLYEKNQTIAQNTLEITRLESLKTADKAEIEKQLSEMSANAYNLINNDKPAAEKVAKEAADAFDAAYNPINANYSTTDEHERKAWEEALLPYIKAWKYLNDFKSNHTISNFDENGNETRLPYSFTSENNVVEVVEVAECPEQKALNYFTIVGKGDFLDAETTVDKYFFKGRIESLKEEVGAPSVEGTSEATGWYKQLEDSQKNLKVAKDALDAELKKAAADQDQAAIDGYNQTIESETMNIAKAEQNIAEKEKNIKEIEEEQKEFKDAVAAVQDATLLADYDKAFASAKEAAEASLKAGHEVHKIEDAIDLIGINSFENNGNPSYQAGEYNDLKGIYDGSLDIEKLILDCKQKIAAAEAAIKAGGNEGWVVVSDIEGSKVEVWNLAHNSCSSWGDKMEVRIYKYAAGMTVEEQKGIIQAEIDKLNEELTVQQTLAEQYKAKLNSMLTAE